MRREAFTTTERDADRNDRTMEYLYYTTGDEAGLVHFERSFARPRGSRHGDARPVNHLPLSVSPLCRFTSVRVTSVRVNWRQTFLPADFRISVVGQQRRG